MFIWMSGIYGYYALYVNIPNLSNNVFTNTSLASLSEAPSFPYLVVATLLTSWKSSLMIIQLIAGLSCFAIGFLPVEYNKLSIAAYMLGIFIFNTIGLQLWLVTAEVYPTNLRSQAVSVCSGVARLITLSSPFISKLSTVWRPLPMFIVGTTSLISFCLSHFLPESQDIELPQTLNQAFQIEYYQIETNTSESN